MAEQAVASKAQPTPRSGLGRLAVGAIGVVFGDIGTSVLYAFEEVFEGAHDVGVTEARVLGAVSLIFWTLTLIVSVKYVLIVMRADNDGEGGIMALTALTRRLPDLKTGTVALLGFLGVMGAALFYGDGMITPAVSVLSAVEGMEVAAPDLARFVVPVAVVILVALFVVQRFGTAKVGVAFGPVMLVWFAVIAVLGLASVVRTPEVLVAVSPTYAIGLFISEPLIAFLSLGSVVLCVTGAEALYADMGHFGAGPIRLSWFAAVVPALYLNYLGQAALIIREPSAAKDPFYLLVPDALLWPVIILATMATVIASQAVLSGAFSMTDQAIRLHYLPRMTVRHTSAEQRGQIYVPFVNWVLFVCVVGLVIGFQDSSRLASAYGIAVTGTFLITTVMITVVARHKWKVSNRLLIPVAGLFLVIDVAFFSANLTKFTHGGWFPLLIAGLLAIVFLTWSRGLTMLRAALAPASATEDDVKAWVSQQQAHGWVPGTVVYVTGDTRVPLGLSEFRRKGGLLRENSVHLALLVQTVPEVPPTEQVNVVEVAPHFLRVEVRYGFMETVNGRRLLDQVHEAGVPLDPETTVVVFHTARVIAGDEPGMAKWRKRLFGFMVRNSSVPAPVASMPLDEVMEWTTIVRL